MSKLEGLPTAEFGPPTWIGNEDEGLAYYEFNLGGTETILLLHGAMTGGPEWDLVVPQIPKQYHILAPDVPLHNRSRNMKLADLGPDTGEALRDLVKGAAKNGKAHVVGLSMGAHIGRRLAVQCPEVVETCFLTGYADLDALPFKSYLPRIVYTTEMLGASIPKSWIDGITFKTDLETPHDFTHFKKVWDLIMDNADVRDKSWESRTLIIAAAKGGIIPTNDSTKDAQKLVALAQNGNYQSRCVQNKTMRHAWSRQDPKLFAEAMTCWIEDKPLPSSFEPI